MTYLPLIHAGATCFMVGLIWFVQIVHYPLMRNVSADGFSTYALSHQQRTTWIVGPVMLVEAASAVMLTWIWRNDAADHRLAWIGLAMLAIVWLSTFVLQVPMHARLAARFDETHWRRLVWTNWIRTITWTLRGGVALAMLHIQR